MIVYVAGRWTRKDEVRRLYALLRAQGHRISHDWTTAEDPDPSWSEERTRVYLAQQAAEDVVGVKRADAVIVLDDPTGRGLFVELGIALAAHDKLIAVVSPPLMVGTCVFYFLERVNVVADPESAVALLSAAEAA